MSDLKQPTSVIYNCIDSAYRFFNKGLFKNSLPEVIFTFQRRSKCMGYFSPNRWHNESNELCHEISINPMYVTNADLIEVLQTLVHEMAHCWQKVYGKPSRAGYHNKEWAEKMASIGLIPSSTGRPGGNKTGQNMGDYPDQNGIFLSLANKFIVTEYFKIPWLDRAVSFSEDDGSVEQSEMNEQSTATISKMKYTCSKCSTNVWGKPGLDILCGVCNGRYLKNHPH